MSEASLSIGRQRVGAFKKLRKIPAPIKIKSALPPPLNPKYPPPQTRNFMDMEVVLQKERRRP